MSRQIKKAVYRIRNWLDCNRARVKRGLRIPWVDHESLDAWNRWGPTYWGAQYSASDAAGRYWLTLRAILPLDTPGDNIMTHLGMPVKQEGGVGRGEEGVSLGLSILCNNALRTTVYVGSRRSEVISGTVLNEEIHDGQPSRW